MSKIISELSEKLETYDLPKSAKINININKDTLQKMTRDELRRYACRPNDREAVTNCQVADLLSAIAKIITNLRCFSLLY